MSRLIFFLLAFPSFAFAAPREVEIRVVDQLTKLPIVGASIRIEGMNDGFVTDEFGTVTVVGCSLKDFMVSVSHVGYEPMNVLVERQWRKLTSVSIALNPTKETVAAHYEQLYAEAMVTFEEKIAKIDTTALSPCDSLSRGGDYTWDAEFPGGEHNLKMYIHFSVKYPAEALELGDWGRVYVSAVIELDGSVTEVKVERGVSTLLDREAKRVISEMPKWLPGYCNGRPVRMKFSLPISFMLH